MNFQKLDHMLNSELISYLSATYRLPKTELNTVFDFSFRVSQPYTGSADVGMTYMPSLFNSSITLTSSFITSGIDESMYADFVNKVKDMVVSDTSTMSLIEVFVDSYLAATNFIDKLSEITTERGIKLQVIDDDRIDKHNTVMFSPSSMMIPKQVYLWAADDSDFAYFFEVARHSKELAKFVSNSFPTSSKHSLIFSDFNEVLHRNKSYIKLDEAYFVVEDEPNLRVYLSFLQKGEDKVKFNYTLSLQDLSIVTDETLLAEIDSKLELLSMEAN